jgi:hypothetical protein
MCSLTAKGDFGAIHFKHTRVAARRSPARRDETARQETEFHQAARKRFG